MPIYRMSGGAGAVAIRKNGAFKVDRVFAVDGILSVGDEYSAAMQSLVEAGAVIEITPEQNPSSGDRPERSNIIARGVKKS